MVIVEFTNDRIKLLEVVKSGKKITIKNLAKRPIGGLLDEAISGVISDLINQSGLKVRGPITISVPRHFVTVRNLRLPSVDSAELKDMVALQAGKQLPYPVSELIWDFKVIENRQDGYSDVFLAIIHRNVIDRYINILKGAKLNVDRIILSSEALQSWYLAGVDDSQSPQAQAAGIKAVIDLDVAHMEILILRDEKIEASRSSACKDNAEEIAEEIRRTFYSYQKDNSRDISSVILTGIEDRAHRLKPLLETQEGSKKVEFVHPLKIISMDYRESLSEYLDLAKDISFSCILGIGYNSDSVKMDFSPPDLKEKRETANKKRIFIKTVLLLAGVGLIALGIFIKGTMDKKSRLDAIEVKIKETEPKVKRLREMAQNVEIIKQNLDTKGSCADIIREVYKTVPKEISIAVLDFELERQLTVRGVSSDLSSVFKFSSALEKSPYFENCQIKYAQKRMSKEKEFVDFEIGAKISRQIK